MPVDNTSLFRARVKTIQIRQAARNKRELNDDTKSEEKVVSHVLTSKQPSSEPSNDVISKDSSNFSLYTSKADEIRNSLTELRDLIISRRKDYISAVGHCNGFALSTSKGMSEWERKEMDDETECAIRQCSQLIRSFQQQIRCDQNLRAADQLIHLEEVAKILNNYLKRVTKMITELRSVRLRRTAAMNRMTKLSTMVQLHENEMRSRKQNSPGSNQELQEDQYNGTNMLLGDSQGTPSTAKISDSTEHPHSPSSGVRRRRKHTKGDEKESIDTEKPTQMDSSEKHVGGYKLIASDQDEKPAELDIVEHLTEKENVQLMAENEKLYSKLAQVDSDVLRIEKQMNQIHRLQETFAEKVLDQERDIEFVNEAAVHTVENIREGNEQIREAIQNMASRRVILLFCIIVLTFTLLFLDWYNP